MNPIELFIARRYLLTKRNVRFINVIGYVSIIGITIGVAALLIALSVFNGFNSVVTSVLVGFDPHLRIEQRGGMTTQQYDSVAAVIQRLPKISAYAPFVSGKAMLSTRAVPKVVFLRGIDEKQLGAVSGVKDRIVLGSAQLTQPDGTPGILLGLGLADRLASLVGNDLLVYSPSGISGALTGMSEPQGVKFRVSGIFESNNKDYDASYAFISLEAAQQLFQYEGRLNGIEIRLHDFRDAESVKQKLAGMLPSGLTISTWYDLHQNLYSVMMIERWSAYVLLSLIVLVATFNMLGSLTMGVMEKRRDIAVLRSMGMTASSIIRVFMAEGMLIGIIGTVLGICIGLVVLFLQIKFHLFPLDPTVYIIPAIPVEIRWTDFIAIPAASLGLSYLAAYYPARQAASTMPAEGVRWE